MSDFSRKRVAIFVDAGFFIRIFTKAVDPDMNMEPKKLAKKMWKYWIRHVDRKNGEQLYRIYFYDCPPLECNGEHPITGQKINFSNSKITKYKNDLHRELRQ